ncbi:GNAT family N-acetyltransferase [Ectothiorhodospiraceae bacterium WFHF3C12]|nr:GNAT family N-acetyltransferase [Ectothiorhodospiraceae bacterium WFHF3C12]
MSRGAAAMETLTGPDSPHWAPFLALYHQAFPAVEREPDELVAARTEAGRYRLRVSLDGAGAVTGCYVVDRVPEKGYVLLCYVAVQPRWRRSGVGRQLCADAVEWFNEEAPAPLLLVEAKPRAARLYRRSGFARLKLDYRVPHIDAPGVEPMELLALPAADGTAAIDADSLARIIRHLFVDGYLVPVDDKRLQSQLARIPAQTRIEHAPVPAAG